MQNTFITIANQINGVDYAAIQIGKTLYNIQALKDKTIITKTLRGF